MTLHGITANLEISGILPFGALCGYVLVNADGNWNPHSWFVDMSSNGTWPSAAFTSHAPALFVKMTVESKFFALPNQLKDGVIGKIEMRPAMALTILSTIAAIKAVPTMRILNCLCCH
jgi:hypothetical protein